MGMLLCLSIVRVTLSSVSHSVMMSCSPVATGKCSLLVDTALSFIKAYRLKGDKDSLRRIVGERFSNEVAKQLLWDSCKHDPEAAGLLYHTHRDSDVASLWQTWMILYRHLMLSSDLIPGIHCEATELLKLPPLSLDPVAEQVQSNSQALQTLISTADCLEKKFSLFLSPSAAGVLSTHTSVGMVADRDSH